MSLKSLLDEFNIGDTISGIGILAYGDKQIICCGPDTVSVDNGIIISRVTISCITCTTNEGLILSPTELFNQGYGFKYDGKDMLPKVVEISQHDRQHPRKFFQKGRAEHDKPFLFCECEYTLRPNEASIAATHEYEPYVYALVPEEWVTPSSDDSDSFGGGRKKKRKSTKRKNKRRSTKRKSKHRRSKHRKYKKTRRRRH